MQLTGIDWMYKTVPQNRSCLGLQNRQSNWPRGKVLGGSSVLNYMLYVSILKPVQILFACPVEMHYVHRL